MTEPQKYEHRHSFIVPGVVDREAFTNLASKATADDRNLKWYVHAHDYDTFREGQCNDRCCVFQEGNVTPLDQLTAGTTPVK